MDERVLNELLECSVCLDRLELSSKVLPCQHTFCRRCLEEIMSTKHELRCPECRSLVEIPIEELPSNILLIRLLEGMKHADRIAASVALSNQGNGGAGRVSVAPTHAIAGAGCHVRAARCSPKPVSTSQPCAKAIYNYDAKEPGDLSFCKGDVVLLRKQVDENWYHGELNGHQGFFPATYVQVITPLPQEIPKCRALYDFVVTDSNEKDCLTFHRDDELTVIRRVDNNWAEGKLADRIGIFPISFVEMNDAAKWLVNAHFNQSNQAGSSRAAPATCSALATPCLAAPIATTAPTFVPSGAAKTVAPPSNPSVFLAQQGSQKRHSMTAISSSPHRSTAPEHHRHSMEIPSGHDAVMAAVAGADGIAVTVAPRTISKVSAASTTDSQTRTSASAGSYPATQPFYVALYNYKPQKADEVELRKGDYYTVTEKCQDGWFKGTCLRSGSVGVFPGNYVQVVKNNSSSKPAVTKATVNTVGGATSELTSSTGNGGLTVVSRSTSSSTQSHSGRVPAVPPHAPVGRTHSFPKTSPRATVSASASTSGQCVTKMPNVTVTHTRTITNVTQAVTRSLMSASQQSRPITHGGDITGVTTVSHAGASKHSDASGNGDKNRGRGSPQVSCRSSEKVTKHSASSSVSANHHHHHHQGQGHLASAAAASSSAHHSMSASVVVSPPNVVVGATSPSNHVVATTTSKEKDKKERREKDFVKLGIMKRLTKNKKSKSPPPDSSTDDASSHPPVPHQRSGSLPVDSQGGATAGISAVQSKKQDSSHQQAPSSSSSSSSSRPGKPKPLVRERYRCIAPYPPQSDIELELKVGDIVYIHKKREDGWFKGTQQRTGKTGLFPGSFVKSF